MTNGFALTGNGGITTPDRNMVIKGLKCIVDGDVRCESCGYAIDKHGHHSCQQNCASDAITLLKGQDGLARAVDQEHRTNEYLAEENERLKAMLKEQEWANIKERMPDKQGYYLVSGGGEVWMCEMLILGNIKGWSNSALRPSVEAWMPFPKPYKEGR